MRIVYINDFKYGGGAETVFRDTYNLMKKEDGMYCDLFYGSENSVVPSSIFSYLFSFKTYTKLKQKLSSFKPDIIHLHNFYHYLSPSILLAIKQYKNKNKCVVYFTAHDFFLLSPSRSFYYIDKKKNIINLQTKDIDSLIWGKLIDKRGKVYSFLKKIQWSISRHIIKHFGVIDTIVSPSAFLKAFFNKKFNDVHLIRNPLKLTGVPKSIGRISKGDILKIVYIGRLSEEKGLYDFLEGLKRIPSSNFTFDIFGDGPERFRIKNYIEINNLKSKVRLRGFVEHAEIANTLSTFDVLVLPSLWYENAPLSLVEAASQGLRLLVPNHGGAKELAELLGNYYFFEKDDPDSIAIAIKAIFKDRIKPTKIERTSLDLFDMNQYIYNLKTIYYNETSNSPR